MRPLCALSKIERLRCLWLDTSGIAAVEFALLAPILMLMTFGTFEVSRALIVHKRFQRAASMVGDLVSREKQLGTTSADAANSIGGIMLAAEHTMQPYSSAPLKVGIYQVRASATNASDTKVEWVYAYHAMPVHWCVNPTTSAANEKTMPGANLITTGNAAIIIEATYQYTPLLTNIIPGLVKQMTWSNTMTFSPRYGSVFYGQATQNTSCPTTGPS